MKIGIVIVNYNDYKTTLKLINNIKGYKCLNSIVIVDNNSNDNSLEELKKIKLNNLIILESNNNKGYSYALNIGCNYLIDKYKDINIILSNSDIIINNEEDIINLSNTLTSDIVVSAPVIEEHGTLNRGWKIPRPIDDIGQNIPYFHDKLKKKFMLYNDNYYQNDISFVEAVSGCFFMITSDHFKKINGFDENVFLYYEENILGVKTKNINKKIAILNNTKVIHDHSVSIDKSMKRIKKYDMQKQSQYYFEKNYNHANIIELILLKLTYYITRLILLIKYLID